MVKGDAYSYDAKDIQVLEGLEAVRRRPGMYVGGTDIKALHHLIYEVVDNSIDEALAGACDRIEIIIHPDSSVTVTDNGRGIPVDIHPQMKKPALEVVMTVLHAGGKFGGGGYKVSGGLHGVGVSAVNALSEWCEVRVRRDGKVHFQRYERGYPAGPVEVIGKAAPNQTGTQTTFKFDPEIFKGDLDFRFDTLVQRFREMAFVTRGVTLYFLDERSEAGDDLLLRRWDHLVCALSESKPGSRCIRWCMSRKKLTASPSTLRFNIQMHMPNRCMHLPTRSTRSMVVRI